MGKFLSVRLPSRFLFLLIREGFQQKKEREKYGLLPYPPRTNFGLKHLICVKSLVFRNSEGEHTSGGELGMGDKGVSGQRRKLHQEWLG